MDRRVGSDSEDSRGVSLEKADESLRLVEVVERLENGFSAVSTSLHDAVKYKQYNEKLEMLGFLAGSRRETSGRTGVNVGERGRGAPDRGS